MSQNNTMEYRKQFLKETISSCTQSEKIKIDSGTSIDNNAEGDSLANIQNLSILSEAYKFEIISELLINLSSFKLIDKYLNSLKN